MKYSKDILGILNQKNGQLYFFNRLNDFLKPVSFLSLSKGVDREK